MLTGVKDSDEEGLQILPWRIRGIKWLSLPHCRISLCYPIKNGTLTSQSWLLELGWGLVSCFKFIFDMDNAVFSSFSITWALFYVLHLGFFGEVFRGVWNGTDVAIKLFLEQDLTVENMEDFCNEISILRYLVINCCLVIVVSIPVYIY